VSTLTPIKIRPAGLLDLKGVEGIEQISYSPYSFSQIFSELEQKNSLLLVAVSGQTIVGWCCSRFVPPEAELLKIAVLPEFRRQGIAALLLHTLEQKLTGNNVTDVYLEVRSMNEAAIKFYLKFGFFQVGLRKKYYSSPQDDALIYKKEINTG
jgi:ribosomal-protein-alanine N-acetyltransferase